jgi:Heparinase II/III-like protein/Heparinase II/III N-terminus
MTLKALFQLGAGPLVLWAVYRLGLMTGHYRRLEAARSKADQAPPKVHQPLFELPTASDLSRLLSPRARGALLREANAVVAGKMRIFGGGYAAIQLAFKGPLRHWTEYELGRTQLPALKAGTTARIPALRPPAQAADIKFLWEPARFGWAFILGRAYRLTGRPKYAQAFWQNFELFDKANPPYLGPHWMNGQEIAIRLLALVWSLHTFAAARPSTARRMEKLKRSIVQHADRIPPTLVYARAQNNNHLVVEAAALYTAGALFGRADLGDVGWMWLNRALQRQIGPFGEYIQHSTNYHRLMLDAVLWADGVRRAQGQSWPPGTLEALTRASRWLFSMLDPETGRVPNLGANDGALILPLSSAEFSDFRPTVQAAARAFLRLGLPRGDWDELSQWLGLPPGEHSADSTAYRVQHLRGEKSWAYLRASSFRSRLGHMDQLHFDLWWRGLNVARDAGTYLYNAGPPWDNPLVSSRVHNTVTVDGQGQMTRGGRFLTLDWAPAFSSIVLEHAATELGHVQTAHDGYRRLGVRHERAASVGEDRFWRVEDQLIFTRRRRHVLRLHWLLMDGEWSLKQAGNELRLRLQTSEGLIRLKIVGQGFFEDGLRVCLIRAGRVIAGQGQANAYDGWFSPTYGTKLPALSLAVEAASCTSCEFKSEFVFPR